MGAAGNCWWLWAWGGVDGVQPAAAGGLSRPFIAPLFNKFQPLEDESLKARVTALMQRCGFAAKGLFVMDGSRSAARTPTPISPASARPSAWSSSTRCWPGSRRARWTRCWRTSSGHFKHGHRQAHRRACSRSSLAGSPLLGWLATQRLVLRRPGRAARLDAPDDALALLLFLLAVPVFGFFVSPLMARLSRKHEFEADAYAAAQAERRRPRRRPCSSCTRTTPRR